LLNLIESLQNLIKSLKIAGNIQSVWNNYYDETILSKSYLQEKEKIFREFISDIHEGRMIDIGCNDGYFSKIMAEKNPNVVAVDFDSRCVNKLYLDVKAGFAKNILPLCINLTNPSPALGFNHSERQSFLERAKSDTVAALALIHHLVLSNNLPLANIAKMFSDITLKHLVVEFVPVSDEKSQQLIANKTTWHHYDPDTFEKSFAAYFQIEKKQIIRGTERVLYRMKKI
jgi:ribosomal protein L11 methylase PrmA